MIEEIVIPNPFQKSSALVWVSSEAALSMAMGSILSARRSLQKSGSTSAQDIQLALVLTEHLKRVESHDLLSQFTRDEVFPLLSHKVPEILSGIDENFYSLGVLTKLKLPGLLRGYEKAVYLDADVEVLGEISKLIELDIGEHWLGAAEETTMRKYVRTKAPAPRFTGANDAAQYVHQKLGILEEWYFNTGVLVLRPQKAEALVFTESAMELAGQNQYWFADQCIFSMMLKGHFFRLSPTWNFQIGDHWPKRKNPDQQILHYSGVFRPWRIFLLPNSLQYPKDVYKLANLLSSRPLGSANWLGKLLLTCAVLIYRSLPMKLAHFIRRHSNMQR